MTVALSIDVLVAAARSSIMSDAPREGEAEAVAPATATRADSERSTSPEGSSASFATCTTTLTDTDSVAPSVRAGARFSSLNRVQTKPKAEEQTP